MKKEYKKPIVHFENLVVSEFIAGSCRIDVGFGDTGSIYKTCGYEDPSFGGAVTIFNDYDTCDTLWAEFGDGGCYHIPDGGHGYFGS